MMLLFHRFDKSRVGDWTVDQWFWG